MQSTKYTTLPTKEADPEAPAAQRQDKSKPVLKGNQVKPIDHKALIEKYQGDLTQCPAFLFQSGTNAVAKPPQPQANADEHKENVDPMQGMSGCPVMRTSSKNPPLEGYTEGYAMAYISPLECFLERQVKKWPKDGDSRTREVFDSYNLTLKHSLFHNDDMVMKTRRLEMASRFFIVDDFCQQGNQSFESGDYATAILCYEKGAACLKWLEYDRPLAMGETGPVNNEALSLLMASFDDDNVHLIDERDDLLEEFELSTKCSMLTQLYANIACAYMRQSYFNDALDIMNEAVKETPKASIAYFRRSQTIAYNKESTYAQLKRAYADIETALRLKKDEPIFRSEPYILAMLNIANAEEAYQFHRDFVAKRMEQMKITEKDLVKNLFLKVKDILFVEDTLRGEQAKEFAQHRQKPTKVKGYRDYELIKEIQLRYNKIIQFHQECGRNDQVAMARKELSEVRVIAMRMEYVIGIDFENYQQDDIIMELHKEMKLKFAPNDPVVLSIIYDEKETMIAKLFAEANFNRGVLKQAQQELLRKTYRPENDEVSGVEEEEKIDTTTVKGKVQAVERYMKENVLTSALFALVIIIGLYILTRHTGLYHYIQPLLQKRRK